MLKINLAQDYTIRDADKQNDPYLKANRCVSDYLIRAALHAKYPQGSKVRLEQRSFKRILDTLTRAVKYEEDVVNVSIDDAKFIKECLAEWSAPVGAAPWLIDLLDYIESALHHQPAVAAAV